MELSKRRNVYPTCHIPRLWAKNDLFTEIMTNHDGPTTPRFKPFDRIIRNPQFNLFAEGDTIYSYGYHFPIARKLPTIRGKGQRALLTTSTYGVTTAKHISAVRWALVAAEYAIVELPPELWDYAAAKRKRGIRDWFRKRALPLIEQYQNANAAQRDRVFDRLFDLRQEYIAVAQTLGVHASGRMITMPTFD